MEKIKFIDLFCGIGGFRVAMDQACIENNLIPECMFSSDIDNYCQDSYEANFGHRPAGDITKVNENDIPEYDVLGKAGNAVLVNILRITV
jgi:DNA (cytosine-5)-methyltransferase 1